MGDLSYMKTETIFEINYANWPNIPSCISNSIKTIQNEFKNV